MVKCLIAFSVVAYDDVIKPDQAFAAFATSFCIEEEILLS